MREEEGVGIEGGKEGEKREREIKEDRRVGGLNEEGKGEGEMEEGDRREERGEEG